MEKFCEFCTAMKPVVYCQADAAYLCLSCDAKVHSANALSNRHLRTLLCDLCRSRPACARCLDHQVFICRSCDRSLHGASSQHQRRLISSYVGCPSAKDFAALWGFELDNLDRNTGQNHMLSAPHASLYCSAENLSSAKIASVKSALACNAESEIGSSSQQFELSNNRQQQQETCCILQQILDLKKLQLNEVNNGTLPVSDKGQAGITKFSTMKKLDDNLDHLSELDKLRDRPLQQTDDPLQELKLDASTFPFSQMEPSPFPSAIINPLLGESFWQCRSPGQTSQLWSQNMQDIGVCAEIVCHDDFDIPDVDISFSNFEELFGGDVDDRDASCSSFDKNFSLEKSNSKNETEKQDASAASIYMCQHLDRDKGQHTVNQVGNIQGSLNIPRGVLRPSYSTLSFTVSRDSTESIGTEFLDSAVSPYFARGKASHLSSDMEASPVEARENTMTRYKEKKQTRRNENQLRLSPRRSRSDVRKRTGGKFVSTECYDSDSVAAARSY